METRKEEIIRTSAVLFKKKGFSAVTMRDIAREMDIKAASLYNHIHSKQEILSAIIISLAEAFTAGMGEIKASESTVISKLRQIITLHIRITSENQYGMASLNNDWMHLQDDLERYLELRLRYEKNFREIIEEGIVKGELKTGNPDVMLFSVLSTLRSLYIWIPAKEDLNTARLSEELSDVLLEGIVA